MKIGKHTVKLSHVNKMMYPGAGITKQDVIDYYDRIAGVMMPHIKGRPLVMHRFPDGIEGKDFFHKDMPGYFPEWIKGKKVKLTEGGTQTLVVVEKKADLIYLANQACLVPHIWLSSAEKINHPDKVVFDMDPPDSDFKTVRFAAEKIKGVIEDEGFTPFLMTSGSKGLHIVIPIKPSLTFEEVRKTSSQICRDLAGRYPEKLTIEPRKDKRKGRLFLDYLRNSFGQTSVAPYALRALPGAPVAAPITWDELKQGKMDPQKYTLKNIFKRLGQIDDPWKNFSKKAKTFTIG